MSRRLGLIANAPPLLNLVSNRPRHAAQKKARPPVADDASPMSTDIEDEDGSTSEGTVEAAETTKRVTSPRPKAARSAPSSVKSDSESDVSAHRRSRQAAIKTTKFGSTGKKLRNEDCTSKKRIKRSDGTKTVLVPGNHLQTKFGFTSSRKTKSTYSKLPNASQSSQPGSSQPPGSSQGSGAKMCIPSSIESPKKKNSSKLIMPGQDLPSSPQGSARKLLSRFNSDGDSSEEDSILASLKTKRKAETTSELSQPRAVFKLPTDFIGTASDEDLGTEMDPVPDLSSADDGQIGRPKLIMPDEFEELLPSSPPPSLPVAKCPWCNEEVDPALLEEFSRGKRLNVRLQTRFCQLHKQHTAKQTWTERGYPEIVWDGIEDRFAVHRDYLAAVIANDNDDTDSHHHSHFRDQHARNVAEGKGRGMKRDQHEDLSPGYYGPRGFSAMCDWLVAEFGDALKRQAVRDRVVAGRGSAAFIQAVLVPELAVRLIMDDMGLSETKARLLMEESKSLGELVHQEMER